MSKEYLLHWRIDLEGYTPEEAAREALQIQRDPESVATFFDVQDKATGEIVRIDASDLSKHNRDYDALQEKVAAQLADHVDALLELTSEDSWDTEAITVLLAELKELRS